MATSIHRCRQNAVWKIEGITPTVQATRKFVEFDPFKADAKKSSGWFRKFFIDYDDTTEDASATNIDLREAWHTWSLQVFYPTESTHQTLTDAILQDRHQLLKALRASGSWKGYDADNTTDDIGMHYRRAEATELDKEDPDVWILVIQLRTKIRESE
ncbi:MAG: hypothetical protein GY835_23940 [bacterium]|nr:hypothetical protein [bacterium]